MVLMERKNRPEVVQAMRCDALFGDAPFQYGDVDMSIRTSGKARYVMLAEG